MAHKKLEQADVITWASVHNIVSIVVTVLAVAIAFYGLQAQVHVLEERVNTLREDVRGLKSVKGITDTVPTPSASPSATLKPTRPAATPKVGDIVGPDTL